MAAKANDETITIVPFDPAGNEAILTEVHAARFTGRDSAAKRKSYAPWLLSNPMEGSIYLAAYVDGAFASFLGFMAREVVGFGRSFRGALAFGAMTLPQFAGRSLYRRLAHAGWEEVGRKGFDFALGYTVRQYVLDMEMRMGWGPMGAAPVMALPTDPAAIIRSTLPRLAALAPLAAPAGYLAREWARWRAVRARTRACAIDPVTVFSPDLDGLNEAWRAAERLTFAKDRRTLDWLYLSPYNPFDYDILEARDGNDLIGFAVGRRMDLRGLDGYGILDLMALPGRDDVLAPLAGRIVEIALRTRPQLVAALVSREGAANAALRTVGFVNSRQAFSLIFKVTADQLPAAVGEPGNWAHFWGNNDTV